MANKRTYLPFEEARAFVRDLKDKLIAKELKNYVKATKEGVEFKLSGLRTYAAKTGEEWFANIRMDRESLTDREARPRG